MISLATTKMLTVDEAADRLHVAKSTMEEWVYNKEIGSFTKAGKRSVKNKNRGTRRISEEELTKFVLLNTLKPARPDWLTAALESEFTQKMREIVRQEALTIVSQIMNERVAA